MVPSSNRVAQTKRESSETSRHALELQHEEISVEAVGSKATRAGVWLEYELVKRVKRREIRVIILESGQHVYIRL